MTDENSSTDEITKIYAIPEMIRTKDDDGFAYPDKYHNKLFEFNKSYVYFRNQSYDTIPKAVVDGAVQFEITKRIPTIVDLVVEQLKGVETPQIDIEKLNLIEERLDGFVKADEIQLKIEEMFGNATNNLNRVIDNIQDKVDERPTLENLQEWRSSIQAGINDALENISVETGSDEIIVIKKQLETIFKRLEMIDSPTLVNPTPQHSLSEEEIIQIIHKELAVVKSNMDNVVKNIINNRLTEISTDSTTVLSSTVSAPLRLTQIAVLRELGLSLDEIKEAKEKGLV